MQPQEWVRAEPWQPGPGLMSAMGLGAGGGEDGARADEEPVSRGEPADGAQSEAVSRSEPEASGSELVSREELSGQAEEPVSRGESMSREANEPGERGGSEAMWRSAIGERSEAVGRMAAVQAPKGVRLRPRPELGGTGGTGGTDLGILPFGEAVHVQRRTEHGWCWVVVVGSGAAGFVEQHFLAMDPPDPGARLLLVKPGDKLHAVVSHHYAVRKGSDARLYVQAIVEANRGRRGVYLDEGELGFVEEVLRTESAERTVETYRGAKVRKGNAIWLPSESFVAALRSLGAIGSGESIPIAAWRGAKAMAGAALDGARYAAAFTIGLLEGGFGAVVDLFSGAAELVQTVAQVALELFTGDGAALVAMARGWVSKLQKVWENRGAIAEDFLSKWESDDAWARGTFQGEVLGWVMMTVLLCIATAGAGALAATGQISGRWAAVLRALAAIDALGDVTAYVGAAARLPAKAAGHVRGKLGMGGDVATSIPSPKATKGTDAWEELDDPLEAQHEVSGRSATSPISVRSGVAEPPDPLLRGGKLDSRQADMDARLRASPERSIEIGMREVTPTDLAALTRSSGIEHAVVILHDKRRLLLRLDSYKGGNLPANTKRLLFHSHPDDHGTGMARFISPQDVEAIVALGQRYSYMVTIDGTVYRFTSATVPYTIGEVVRTLHPIHGWVRP